MRNELKPKLPQRKLKFKKNLNKKKYNCSGNDSVEQLDVAP